MNDSLKNILIGAGSSILVAALAAALLVYKDVEILKLQAQEQKEITTLVNHLDKREAATESAVNALDKTVDKLIDKLDHIK